MSRAGPTSLSRRRHWPGRTACAPPQTGPFIWSTRRQEPPGPRDRWNLIGFRWRLPSGAAKRLFPDKAGSDRPPSPRHLFALLLFFCSLAWLLFLLRSIRTRGYCDNALTRTGTVTRVSYLALVPSLCLSSIAFFILFEAS
ncbi:hypothetical protein BC827DRAFT_653150 [Russula dissimulans]|nr:hypothetical protein BC827DRAFT_653150 [Russula dissimulans]